MAKKTIGRFNILLKERHEDVYNFIHTLMKEKGWSRSKAVRALLYHGMTQVIKMKQEGTFDIHTKA